MSDNKFPKYEAFADTLKSVSLSVTPAELHGFLTGMLAGGLSPEDGRWQPLLFDYTNDGMGWPMAALGLASELMAHTAAELTQNHFQLWLLLPPDDGEHSLFELADGVSEWVNHFISGLGLAYQNVNKLSNDAKEALKDLEEIARLGIDEDDDLKEQALLLEQVIEHVKACALALHAECGIQTKTENKRPTIH
ncbi:YecA family protein [Vibrio ruber]|uniref:UPF0149 protein VR7878_00161 n=1 Tax=Vibrio ruber (strain DSM 16370 / JCM 11486 / BCRC 17186 / CECT 7878 / LMG 23124 / VR1) TaxID=1123498 RepID=A0A1R4L9J1_VIBR1|nr:YecA family protein [Vibrio ruber]WNJ96220.1 YecA family protein [Vibrio ruber]SJN53057.1 hypothetical protein VR7878_00161 [Vibrio ruber DSM 16370]